MSDLYDFVIKLRAIREYRDEPLSNEDLEAILEAGRWTGSSKNDQAWTFVAITDPERIAGLASFGNYTKPIENSVAAIVLVQEKGGNPFDIGRAAQNMMLAAKAVGVASCPVTLQDSEAARQFVGAPEGSTVRFAISLGYPSEMSSPGQRGGRRDTRDVVKLDRY